MAQVLIYNQGGAEVLGEVSLRHAVGMLHRRVAKAREWIEGETFGPFPRVTSVELLRAVLTKWLREPGKTVTELLYERTGRVLFSRTNVMARDNYMCAYCPAEASTWDHVVPKVQGGVSSWTNCVAACYDCNQFKGGRTPEQADMPLRWTPEEPSFIDDVLLLVA